MLERRGAINPLEEDDENNDDDDGWLDNEEMLVDYVQLLDPWAKY